MYFGYLSRPSAFALRSAHLLVFSAALLSLTSCSRISTNPQLPIADAVAGSPFGGLVHGGQQPVSGSTIQLYAVGNTGDGSTATPLLSQAVRTTASGAFSISGLYTCPSSSTLVYLVATGGNPGLGTNNPNLALMAALGPCGSLNSSTFVSINEVTTVGSVFSLAQFMYRYNDVGYGSDLSVIAAAFAEVNIEVSIATGIAPGSGVPAGYGVPVDEINTIADILASCVNSAGGTAGDGSACGKLFADAGGSSITDTVAAAVVLASNPSGSLADLFTLVTPNSPFFPALSSPPSSWTIAPLLLEATPVISPAGGTYHGTQSVSLTDATAGATIYYTADGSTPSAASTPYTGPITVTASETVNAIAEQPGHLNSAVASASYVITAPYIGVISTFAGTGTAAYNGDNIPAVSASLNAPSGVTVDASGNVYIADSANNRVRKVAPSGVITTIAGNNSSTYASNGDGGLATAASVPNPTDVKVDATGNIYIAELVRVRKVNPAGIISTVAGDGAGDYPGGGYSGEGGLATSASITPQGIALDSSGNLYISDNSDRILKVNSADIISTVAGNGTWQSAPDASNIGDGGPATQATVNGPRGLAFDSGGNLYIADYSDSRVREVNTSGIISTVAGGGSAIYHDGELATAVGILPSSVAFDGAGNLYIAGYPDVYEVNSSGLISGTAGNGSGGYTGDGGLATAASLNRPRGIAFDSSGDVFIADTSNSVVREVTFEPSPVASPLITPGTGYVSDYTTVTLSTTTANTVIRYTLDGTAPTLSSPTYTGAISVTVSNATTINAVAFTVNGGIPSPVSVAMYTPVLAVGVSFSVPQGTYNTPQTLTLSLNGTQTPEADYEIYYTTDGTAPTFGSTHYTGPIIVSTTETITATAFANGATSHRSDIRTYTVIANPVISPGTSYVSNYAAVSLTTTTPSSVIHYMLDGTTPTLTSPTYTGPFSVTVYAVTTLNAVTFLADGGAPSGVSSATYTPVLAVDVSFSVPQGTYNTPQTVALSLNGTQTPGADYEIYYTTDGTAPTQASTHYTGPFTVSNTETITATAFANGATSHRSNGLTYTITSVGSATPKVTSVSAIVAAQTQTITITGSGFGTQAPYTGTSYYISLWDVSQENWEAGYGEDGVGLIVSSWTDTSIVLQGYSGDYGPGGLQISTGDNLSLSVWNTQISRAGLYDPSAGSTPGNCTNITVGGGATTCH